MLGFRRRRKKYTFSSSAPFQAGGPAVSSRTLIPSNRWDIAPATIGFLPVGAKGRSFVPSLALCSQDCNSVQSVEEPGHIVSPLSSLGIVCWNNGASILALKADERVANVSFSPDSLSVALMDCRTISVPLVWYPKWPHATEEQLKNWKIAGGGYGIYWPDLDEDLSTEGLLRGAPAPHHSARV
jgi:hypothetical protein